jgi:F-type H+-transporting ATPase subunit gamma
MSQLIHMRQRIKAVETIKKITHAMRLISMSSHSRIRGKRSHFEAYRNELRSLYAHLKDNLPDWNNTILYPDSDQPHRRLIIIVGSQKGLCGSFNTQLFSYFQKTNPNTRMKETELCCVGNKAVEYVTSHIGTPDLRFEDFSSSTLVSIAQQITDHIFNAHPHYTSVSIISNWPRTFFVQRPQQAELIPFGVAASEHDSHLQPYDEYLWEESPRELLDTVAQRVFTTNIQTILLDSLVAEQAARFIAMDNSTRNASTLLDTMKLQYNKLRQTKITRELTDLIGSF